MTVEAAQPEPENTVEATNYDNGAYDNIVLSLNNETPLMAEYIEGDDYSTYAILENLYNNSPVFIDGVSYNWFKDDVAIDNLTMTGSPFGEDVTYFYEDNGTTVEMFTLSKSIQQNTMTLAPATLGEYTVEKIPIYTVYVDNEEFNGDRVGATVDVQIDKNYGNVVEVSPSDLVYTVDTQSDEYSDIYTFDMPNSDVYFTMELPAPSTLFDFTGYEDNVTETPSSTGTVTYDGIYADDSTYIMGTATVTFTGTAQDVERTVYISRSDAPSIKTGARIPVYVMNNDQLVLFGYGELTQQ